ncbi:MAG: recombinase family protein [Solirubrobacteraceae bacterium]
MTSVHDSDDAQDDSAGPACGAPDDAPGGRADSPRRVLRYVRPADDDADESAQGLADALERIAAGEASVLIVERLRDVGESVRELVGVIEWLQAADADLVAEDVALDTGSDQGARMVTILREIASWEYQPGPRRPPRGRPGIDRQAPELTERIAAMREAGLTLQAIADALNADRVPTPRGGARWRPSSVQSVLGYRRPRPPAPGLPPHPPRPPALGLPPHQPRPPRPGRRPTRRPEP